MTNRNFIILALTKLEGEYTSTSAYIANEIGKHNNVLWVEKPITLKDLIKTIFKEKSIRYLRNILTIQQKEFKDSTFWVLVPFLVFPINFLPKGFIYNLFSFINHQLLFYSIKHAIKKLQLEDYIYINSHNFYFPNISKMIKAKLNVYHCVDGMKRAYTLRHAPYLEKKLLNNSDLVITTSKQLRKDKLKYNSNTHFIANAADIQHSIKARLKAIKIPDVLKNNHSTNLGYIGNIERRIDFELLYNVMKRNPSWKLFMIGPIMKEYIPDYFETLDNIYFVGPVPYQQLPNYLKGLDITLIPYKVDNISNTIFPLKLYEYLGAGKPVITTNFNPDILSELSNELSIIKSISEFETAVKKYMRHNNADDINRRIAIAKKNTWVNRGTAFLKLLEINLN